MREKDRRIAELEEQLAEAEEDFDELLEWTYAQGYIRCDRCDAMTLQETGFQCHTCDSFVCGFCEEVTIIEEGPVCVECVNAEL